MGEITDKDTNERTTLVANKYTGLAFVWLFCTVVEDDINTSIDVLKTLH